LRWQSGSLLLADSYVLPPQPDTRPNVLLISLDTLRADHFSATHMPRIYALFEQGLIWDRAYTPTTWTLPAHASLLSGLYPTGHGVRQPDQRLPETVTTLAEQLREAGYFTAAFTEGNYVSASFGLDQGFLHYEEHAPGILETDPAAISKLAENVAALRAGLDQWQDLPVFAFFHSYEVHCPYVPRDELEDEAGIGLTQWLLDHDGEALDAQELELLRALYAGEVAYTDQLLAPLLEELVARGDWLIVLVSDHGEEFGEHGGLLHADTVYEETARIPLAMVGAGLTEHGRSDAVVSLVDVPATILTRLGVAPPQSWQGRDMDAPPAANRPVFAESTFFGVHLEVDDPGVWGIWQEAHKLITWQNLGREGVELYDLTADPNETHNLQQEAVGRRNALYRMLATYREEQGLKAVPVENLTPEQIETMRSLGYIK
jgi:arylsulfatase A-like enzyme